MVVHHPRSNIVHNNIYTMKSGEEKFKQLKDDDANQIEFSKHLKRALQIYYI